MDMLNSAELLCQHTLYPLVHQAHCCRSLACLQKALGDSESSLVLPYVTLSTKRAHLAVALQHGLSRAAYQGARLGEVAIAGPCAPALAETELISTADVKVRTC